jgi:hypothetical protein
MARYDVTIQERGPRPGIAALAAVVNVAQGEVKPVADERFAELAAEVQAAASADSLAVDQRLEAAEREFPSDYRFTYARATLAVYGRADHHEAFYHLRRAADKAIGTQRAREMLDRLEQDGGVKGRLRKLAVGHAEWSVLHEALEHRDRDRLWQAHASHVPAPATSRKRASAPTQPAHDGVPARVSASVPLEHETPCLDALAAHRHVPMDHKARKRYHRLRELCLRGSYAEANEHDSVRDAARR